MNESAANRKPQQELVLERFMPFKVAVLSNNIASKFAERYGRHHSLSVADWRVLAVVVPQPGSTAREVVELTNIEKTQVSRAVARMTDRNLLLRVVNAEDRRLHHLSATPAGLSIYRALAPEELELEARLLKGFSAEQLATLDALLDRLHAAVQAL